MDYYLITYIIYTAYFYLISLQYLIISCETHTLLFRYRNVSHLMTSAKINLLTVKQMWNKNVYYTSIS